MMYVLPFVSLSVRRPERSWMTGEALVVTEEIASGIGGAGGSGSSNVMSRYMLLHDVILM